MGRELLDSGRGVFDEIIVELRDGSGDAQMWKIKCFDIINFCFEKSF